MHEFHCPNPSNFETTVRHTRYCTPVIKCFTFGIERELSRTVRDRRRIRFCAAFAKSKRRGAIVHESRVQLAGSKGISCQPHVRLVGSILQQNREPRVQHEGKVIPLTNDQYQRCMPLKLLTSRDAKSSYLKNLQSWW